MKPMSGKVGTQGQVDEKAQSSKYGADAGSALWAPQPLQACGKWVGEPRAKAHQSPRSRRLGMQTTHSTADMGSNWVASSAAWKEARRQMEEAHASDRGPAIRWRRLRPHCCCCCHHCCLVLPTRGGPAPAGCDHVPPWPAPLHGPTHGRAPAPTSRAAPKALAPSRGTASAALNPASLAGPAGPCTKRGTSHNQRRDQAEVGGQRQSYEESKREDGKRRKTERQMATRDAPHSLT